MVVNKFDHNDAGASCREGESYSRDNADDGSEALGTVEYLVPQAVSLSHAPCHCYLHIVEGSPILHMV